MGKIEDEVVADRRSGVSIKNLAKRYGMGQRRVYRILNEAGVDIGDLSFRAAVAAKTGKPNRVLADRSTGIGRKPSSEEWAYIAGIFDGEGSLTYNGSSRQPRVSISQNRDSGLHEWLLDTLGAGGISEIRGRNVAEFRLFTVRSVYEFLVGIMPYVVVKRDKVENGLSELRSRYGWE